MGKRTLGVTIVGWIMALISLPYILGPLIILSVSFSGGPLKGQIPQINSLDLIVNCCFLVAAIGILKLNNFARICAIWFSVYMGIVRYLFYYMYCIIYYRGSEAAQPILKMLSFHSIMDIGIYTFFIYFLTRPRIKEQFK